TQTPGKVNVVNAAGSPFGAGWSLDNLEHAWPAADFSGVMVELPGGQSLWFASPSLGTYLQPPGDFSTFAQVSGGYQRTLKDGTQITFAGSGPLAGYQTSIYEPILNRTLTFVYNTNNPPQLIGITDFQGLTTTLAYNVAGKLSSFQDPALRITQLGY